MNDIDDPISNPDKNSIDELEEKGQTLIKTYSTLLFLSLTTFIGSFLNYTIFQIPSSLSIFLSFIILFIIIISKYMKDMEIKWRIGMVGLFGMIEGFCLSDVIGIAYEIDPMVIIVTSGLTICVFVSFTICAFWMKDKWVFIGSILSSMLGMLIILGVANIFLGYNMIFLIELYGGLVVFVFFIVYDTQMIMKKIIHGNYDYVDHAITLYLDLLNVFIRILIIMMRRKENQRNNDGGGGFGRGGLITEMNDEL